MVPARPGLLAGEDLDLTGNTKRYDMQAHWRRWLAASACVLAVLVACFVIAAPRAGGGSPGTPLQLAVNLVSAPMAVPPARASGSPG